MSWNPCRSRPVDVRKISRRPIFLEFRSSKVFIVFAVVFAVFTDIFLYGLIVPVVPSALEERVEPPIEDQQRWTSILLALYGAALFATSPAAGFIADRIQSRRGPFLFGLLCLSSATALLCIGTRLGLWIAGRLFQGASAAIVWTVGMALIADTVEPEQIGRAMGFVGMAMTIGTLLGPLLGGVLYEHGGYYSVFGLAFGLLGLDIFLRLTLIEKRHAAKWLEPKSLSVSPIPTQEKGASVDSPTSVSDDSSNNQDESKPSPAQESMFAPFFYLLSSERLCVTFWSYFVVAVILTGFDGVLPLFVEDTFDWDQTAQGLIFVPLAIPHVFDPLVGFFIDHCPGIRRYIGSGALFASVPIFVLLRLVTNESINDKVLLCALLALTGLCLTFLLPPLMVEVAFAVGEREESDPQVFGEGGGMGLGYGMMNAAFAAGSIVGPFFTGYIRDSAGWGTMAWALAVLTGVTALPVLLVLGGFIWQKQEKKVEDEPVA